MVAQKNALGSLVKAQVFPRGVGIILGHEMTLNPFVLTEVYRKLLPLPLSIRVAILRQPEVRAAILSGQAATDPSLPLAALVGDFERMFPLTDPLDYEPSPETSIAARAHRLGVAPDALAYDMLLEQDGRAAIYLIVANYDEMNLEEVRQMMLDENTMLGPGPFPEAGSVARSKEDCYPRLVMAPRAAGRTEFLGLMRKGELGRRISSFSPTLGERRPRSLPTNPANHEPAADEVRESILRGSAIPVSLTPVENEQADALESQAPAAAEYML